VRYDQLIHNNNYYFILSVSEFFQFIANKINDIYAIDLRTIEVNYLNTLFNTI